MCVCVVKNQQLWAIECTNIRIKVIHYSRAALGNGFSQIVWYGLEAVSVYNDSIKFSLEAYSWCAKKYLWVLHPNWVIMMWINMICLCSERTRQDNSQILNCEQNLILCKMHSLILMCMCMCKRIVVQGILVVCEPIL